jgi:hypothetical protein
VTVVNIIFKGCKKNWYFLEFGIENIVKSMNVVMVVVGVAADVVVNCCAFLKRRLIGAC